MAVICRPRGLGGDAARRRPASDSTTSTAAAPSTYRTASAIAPLARNSLAAELALLPGLNGPWWFEETPWLTPFLRQAIADKVLASTDLAAVLGDHPQRLSRSQYGRGAEVALGSGRTMPRGPVAGPIATVRPTQGFSDGNHDDDARAARTLDDALQQFVDGHRDGAVVGRRSPYRGPAAAPHRRLGPRQGAGPGGEEELRQGLGCLLRREKHAGIHAAALPGRFGRSCARKCWAMPRKPSNDWTRPWPQAICPLLFHVSTLVARGDIAAASADQLRRIRRPPFRLCQEASGGLRCGQAQPSAGGARCRALCLEPDGSMEGRGGEQAVSGRLPYSLDQQGGEESLGRDFCLPRSPWHGHGLPLPRQSRRGAEDLQGGRRRNQGGPGRGPDASTAPIGATNRASVPSANSLAQFPGTLGRLRTLQRRGLRRKSQPAPGRRILRPGPEDRARMERCRCHGL